MDSPKEAPTGSTRARRRMHQCPHCDEIFVDEESFEKHKLTHGDAAAAPPPAAASAAAAAAPPPPAADAAPSTRPTRASRAAAAAAAAAAPTPAAAAAPAAATVADAATRPVSAVRQEAGIGGPGEILGEDLGEALPYEEMGTGLGLGPMEWEEVGPPRPNPFIGIYKFIEDFSEWLFHGLQRAVGVFGLSLVPAIGIAIRGTVILLIAFTILGSGMMVGRKYGPWLMGQKADDPPLLPPQRIIPVVTDETKLATQTLLDFYGAIDSRSYSVAYDLLSPAWKKELYFNDFEKGYQNTESVRCSVTETKKNGEGRVELKADIEVAEHGSTRKFLGTYQAVGTDLGWRLDSGSLAPQ